MWYVHHTTCMCTHIWTHRDTLEPGVCRRHHVDARWGTLFSHHPPSPSFTPCPSSVLLLAGLFPSDTFTFSARPISWKSLDFLPSHSWTSEFPDSPSFLSSETNAPCFYHLFLQSLAHLSPALASSRGRVSTPPQSLRFHTSYRLAGSRSCFVPEGLVIGFKGKTALALSN